MPTFSKPISLWEFAKRVSPLRAEAYEKAAWMGTSSLSDARRKRILSAAGVTLANENDDPIPEAQEVLNHECARLRNWAHGWLLRTMARDAVNKLLVEPYIATEAKWLRGVNRWPIDPHDLVSISERLTDPLDPIDCSKLHASSLCEYMDVVIDTAESYLRRPRLPLGPDPDDGLSFIQKMYKNFGLHLPGEGKHAPSKALPVARVRRRGPRPLKREAVTEAMLVDLRSGAISIAQLRDEKEEYLASNYGVSRGVIRSAREEALSLFRKEQPIQKQTN